MYKEIIYSVDWTLQQLERHGGPRAIINAICISKSCSSFVCDQFARSSRKVGKSHHKLLF